MTKFKLDDIIEYIDDKRRGIVHFGKIIEIRINKDNVYYVTQDNNIVFETKILNKYEKQGDKNEN